jgi:hypothetical protein
LNLFCFASRDAENIRLGIAARKWAVATVSDSAMKSRIGRAKKYFKVGSRGLLYCNPTQSFTTPFVVESEVDPFGVVTDIWSTPWVLPFSIRPLGDLSRQVSSEIARLRWPFVDARWPASGGISAAMNITGVTVFSPVPISEGDWRLILDDLATNPNGVVAT